MLVGSELKDKAQGTKVRCRSGKGSGNDSVTEGADWRSISPQHAPQSRMWESEDHTRKQGDFRKEAWGKEF